MGGAPYGGAVYGGGGGGGPGSAPIPTNPFQQGNGYGGGAASPLGGVGVGAPLAPLSAGATPLGGGGGGYPPLQAGLGGGAGYPPLGNTGVPMALAPTGAARPPEKKPESSNLLFAELSPIAAVKGIQPQQPPPAAAARGPPMGSLGAPATPSNPFGNTSQFNPFSGKPGDLL